VIAPWAVLFLFLLFSVLLYHAHALLLTTALLWSLGLFLLHYHLVKSQKIHFYRAIFFILLAVTFLAQLHLGKQEENNLLPYCHLAQAGNLLSSLYHQFLALIYSSWGRFGVLSIGLSWALALLAVGGSFCSFICFFGGVDDALSQVLKKPALHLGPHWRLRDFQLAFFIFLILVTLNTSENVFCLWVCPYKITPALLNPIAPQYAWQKLSYLTIAAGALFLLPILTKKRFFCSTLCPFGALPPLLARWLPYRLSINPRRCTGCGQCEKICPSFALERTKGEDKIQLNRFCTFCARCLPVCPQGAISYTLAGRPSLLIVHLSFLLGGVLSLFYAPLLAKLFIPEGNP
jgi:polyferredoxin